jgi:hypothetical protein
MAKYKVKTIISEYCAFFRDDYFTVGGANSLDLFEWTYD